MAGCKYCGRDLAKTHLSTCPLAEGSDAQWLRKLAESVRSRKQDVMANRLEHIADRLDDFDQLP